MSVSTRFTDLVGCELPIQLAAMGGVGTTQLAGAVVSAGGMGMVPSAAAPVARAWTLAAWSDDGDPGWPIWWTGSARSGTATGP